MMAPAANNVVTTLAQSVAIGDTSMLLVDASAFPSAGVAVLAGVNPLINEVVLYTGKSGNALTGCVRGYDGTTAATHAVDAMIALALIAKHITDLQPKHGTTSDRVAVGLTLNVADTGRPFYDTEMDAPFMWVKDRWAMATVSVGSQQIRDFIGDAATVLPQNYRRGDRWTDLDSPLVTFRMCKAAVITHTLADWIIIGRQG